MYSHLDTKLMTYQYKGSHYKDKTVLQPSYIYNG